MNAGLIAGRLGGFGHEGRRYATLVRLAFGLGVAARDLDWEHLLAIAASENCVSLCWHRGGDQIRDHAPAEVVERWRRAAFLVHLLADRRIEQLHHVLDALNAAAVPVLVLKGPPLALRLHGTLSVRPMQDIDLLVAPDDRTAARGALTAWGWQHSFGAAPHTEVFLREHRGRLERVEVHSLVFGEELTHLRDVPVPVEWVTVGNRPVPALGMPLLPAYLAVHLARHDVPPLLWLMELHLLWTSLGEREREEAIRCARATRVSRYLRAMLRVAAAVPDVAMERRSALRRIGVRRLGRRTPHPAWLLVRGASTVGDAARALGAVLLPPSTPRSGGRTRAVLVRIVRKIRWRVLLPTRLPMAVGPERTAEEDAPLAAERSEWLDLVRLTVSRGAGLWVAAHGSSMVPSVPMHSRVLLAPASRAIRPGDVVLARLASGQPVIHRVRLVVADRLILRGDNLDVDDPPVGRGDVLAVATHVKTGMRVTRLRPRSPGWGGHWLGRLRRKLGTLMARQQVRV